MKALTLWQPWASLVVGGAKPWEFRGWRPPRSIVGERIVIHAAARKVDPREVEQLIRLLRAGGRYAAATCLLPIDTALIILRTPDLPIGAGLGTAIVGEPVSGHDIAIHVGATSANDSDRADHANWGWPMRDIEQWDTPVPMRGAQSLWTWPTPAEVAL